MVEKLGESNWSSFLGILQVTKVLYECSSSGEELDKLENGSKGVYLSECEG